VLSLPHLKVIVSDMLVQKTLKSNLVNISDDGRVTIWSSNREFRHFYVFDSENRHKIPSSWGVAHDSMVAMPDRPPPLDDPHGGGLLTTLSRKFSGTPWTSSDDWKSMNKELDDLYAVPVENTKSPATSMAKINGRTNNRRKSINESQDMKERRELLGESAAAASSQSTVSKDKSSNNAFINAKQVFNISHIYVLGVENKNL
jgi:hypothetical protein